MDTNNALYKVLVGVDERRSASLMNQQLADAANRLKELSVRVRVEPGLDKTLKDSIKQIQNNMPKRLEISNVDILKKEQDAINDLVDKYRGMGGTVEKIVRDNNGEISSLIMKVQDLNGNIQNITFDKDLNEKSSTFFTGFGKGLETLRGGIAQTEKALVKITKEIASGKTKPGMIEEQAKLTKKLAEDYGKLHLYIQRSTVASDARKNVLRALISEEHKASQATIDRAEELGKEALAYENAKSAVASYKKDLKLLTDVKLGKDVGEPEEDINKRLKAQRKLAEGYTDLTKKMDLYKEEEDRAFNTKQIQNWEKNYSSALNKVSQNSSNLEKLYEKLRYAMEHGDTQGIEVLNIKIKNAEQALQEAQLAAVEFGTKLDYVDTQSDMDKVAAEVLQIKDALLSAEAMAERLEGRFGKVRQEVAGNRSMAELVDLYEKGAISADEFAQGIYGASAKVKKASKENSNYAQMTKSLEITMDDANGKTIALTATVDKSGKVVREVGGHFDATKQQITGFGNQIMDAAKKIATWGLSTKIVYGTWRAFQDGIETVKELDAQLTQIAIVQGKGRETARAYGDSYVDIAVKMAQSVQDVAKLNTELIRQGLGMDQAADRADTIMKLSAAGMVSMEQSLQVITTGVNALGEAHEKVADVILKASMLSASDVEGLGEAFSKTASGARAAGLSIEETSALLATMKEVTQEGDSQLGTSLKSMLARFNKINEETGELNEDLNQVQTAIESVGVEFLDAQGQIRSFYDITQDLSGIWGTLDKNTKAYIATQAAGVRQQNRFFAVMDNFNKVQAINNDLARSAGTLQQSYATYLDSTEAAGKRLQATLDKLWMNFIDSNVLRDLTNFATSIVTIVDKVGLLSIALTVLGLKLTVNLKNAKALFNTLKTQSIASAGGVIKLSGTVTALSGGLKIAAVSAATLGKTLIAMAPQLILIAGVSWGIGKIAEEFMKASEAAKAAKQAQVDYYNETIKMIQSQHTQEANITSLGEEYLELSRKVKQAGGTYTLAAEELERYYEVQAQLKEIIPILSSYEDERGRVILNGVNSVDGLTNSYKELLKAQIAEAAIGYLDRVNEKLTERNILVDDLIDKQKKLGSDEAYGGDFKRDDKTGEFKLKRIVGAPTEAEIARAKELQAEWEALEKQRLVEVAKTAEGVISVLRLKMLDEFGEIPNELSLLLSQTPIALEIMELPPEQMMAYVTNLKNNLDTALQGANFGEGLSSITDVFAEVERLGQQHLEGVINTEQYNAKMRALTDALKVVAETSTDEIKVMVEAALEAIGAMGTEAPKVLEEAAESVEDIAARHKEATGKFISDYNSLKSELNGMATLFGQVTDAKITDAEVDQAILNTYPQWMQFLGDRKGLEDALAQAYTDTANAQAEAYIVMLENTGQFTMSSYGMNAEFFNKLGIAYTTDLANSKSRAEAKLAVEHSLIQSMGDMWTKFFKATGEGILVQIDAISAYAQENKLSGEAYKYLVDSATKAANKMNSQVNAFSDSMNKIVVDTSKINSTMGGIKNHADSINKALGKKGAAGSAKDLADAAKEAADAIKEYNEAMKATQDATKEVFDFALKYIKWIEEQKREAMEETFEAATKAAEDYYDDQIEDIEEQLEAELKVLELKQKQAKAEDELLEYLRKRKELQDGIVDLEYQLAIASLDSSVAGIKKRRDLQQTLEEERKKLIETEEERDRRIQEEMYAREQAFMESQAEYQKMLEEQIRDDKLLKAQEIYDAEKAYLDKKYSDENAYLLARQATQEGMIENLHGNMIPLVDAFEELAKANGEFWTFFGQQEVEEFGTKVESVLEAIKRLGFETIQTWKEVASAAEKATNAANAASAASSASRSTSSSAAPTNSGPSTPAPKTQTQINREFQSWMKDQMDKLGLTKPRGFAVDGAYGPATRAAATLLQNKNDNNHSETEKLLAKAAQSTSIPESSLLSLKKYGIRTSATSTGGGSGSKSTYMAYAEGGKVDYTGPALVHGSKSKPEYVFNYQQFKDLAKMIARHELTKPIVKSPITTQPISVRIDKLIEVQGSVDKNTLPELQRMTDDAVNKLANKLKGWGK